MCDSGYIKGDDCTGCVRDPENDGCPANASRVNGQCACNRGYKQNESGCGCVPLPTCTTLYRCGYKHVHYASGEDTFFNELTGLEVAQLQASTYQACLERKAGGLGTISSLPPEQRCVFQGCNPVFSEASCAGASLFTCRYKHMNYPGQVPNIYIEATSNSLVMSLMDAYDVCVSYRLSGKLSSLPPDEACKLMECKVSG
ncbi:hypothetical protein P2318_25005 [Myxococcaceae bacterium GXIMD 01537]